MAENYQAPADLSRYRTIALGVGGIALIIWAAGTYFNVEQGLRSWLLGFIFWGGITMLQPSAAPRTTRTTARPLERLVRRRS